MRANSRVPLASCGALAICVFFLSASPRAETARGDPILYRIFLDEAVTGPVETPSSTVVSFGHFARVGDRVVFSLPLSADPAAGPLQLVGIPAASVDWPATDRYADSARYDRYLTTRFQSEASRASVAVARSVVGATEPAFPPPELQEMVMQALTVARLTTVPAERLSVLETVIALLDESDQSVAADWKDSVWELATQERAAEVAVERAYAQLGTDALEEATHLAVNADVRGVQAVMDRVLHRDGALGNRRPNHVLAVVTAIDEQLAAARALRLQRDHWQLMAESYRRYDEEVGSVVEQFDAERAVLDDVRVLAGPDADLLLGLEERLERARAALDEVFVPEGVRGTHGLFRQALGLAVQSVVGRRMAVTEGDLGVARDAASAAAGAFLLFDRAIDESQLLLTLPDFN